MVLDKETKMRETLKIMSMKTAAYGLSYFLSQLVFVVFTTIVFCVTFLATGLVDFGQGLALFIALLV
jgi:hypothetical protein